MDRGANIEAINYVSENSDVNDDNKRSFRQLSHIFLSVCVLCVSMETLLFVMLHIEDMSRSFVFFWTEASA